MIKSLMGLFFLCAFALTGEASRGKMGTVNTPAFGGNVVAGQKYVVGSYVYVGGPAMGGAAGSYIYIEQDSIYAGGSLRNMNASVVTAERVASKSTGAVTGLIRAHLDKTGYTNGASAHGGHSAYAAGDAARNMGLWSRVNWTKFDDNTNGAKMNANIYSIAIGADRALSDNVLVGVAANYGYLTGKTEFNHGKLRYHSYGVTPYAAIKLHRNLSADIMAGFNFVTKKTERNQQLRTPGLGGPDVLTNRKVTGRPKANRFYGSFGLSSKFDINNMLIGGRVAVTHVTERQGKFSEDNGDRYNTQTARVNFAGARFDVGLKANEYVSPYLFIAYDYYFSGTAYKPENKTYVGYTQFDRGNTIKKVSPHQYGGGLGMNFKGSDFLVGGVEYQYTQQSKIKQHSVTGTIRFLI